MPVYIARYILPVAAPMIQDGAIAVHDGLIVDVGPKAAVLKTAGSDAEVRDLGDAILLPGLVNAHTHLELSWMAEDPPESGDYVTWVKGLWERRQRVDGAVAEAAAEQQLGAMHARGTVAVGDVSRETWTVPLLARSPLYGVAFIEISGLKSEQAEKILEQAAERLEALTAALDLEEAAGGRIQVSLTAEGPHTTSAPLLRALAGRSGASGEPLSLHVSQCEAEVALLRDGSGPLADLFRELELIDEDWKAPARTPVDHLHHLGVLTPRTLAVNCVHLDQQDHSMLQAGRVTAVTCPRSNQRLGSGKAPIPKLMSAGVPVALGTGSLASVPDLDLFADMAALLEQHPKLTPAAVLRMATLNGARALGLADRLGSVENGRLAELIVVPLAEDARPPLEVICSNPPTVYHLAEAPWEAT
jgi:cytosine/adenosine deaminase-related metal-dependent hydrolase